MPPRNPLPYALASFAVAALIEYPLGRKYPLKKRVPMLTRMLTAGALAFGTVYAANWLVSAWQARPQLPQGTPDR